MKEMNFGELLAYAQRYKLHTIPANDPYLNMPHDQVVVSIGPFRMQAHDHQTGITVDVSIVGAGDPYQIISGTYWKQPAYEFNKFINESGPWDEALHQAEEQLRRSCTEHMFRITQEDQQHRQQSAEYQERRRQEVAKLFL